ncbi:ABC transporter ATP-binding protein [Microbispora sp. CA-135349]|uniref:ABC transporter ATP-binding protein n=1 Tax=Microbispora sp. CA-135349 TaxID=3239953 RepID=UPI003D8B9027
MSIALRATGLGVRYSRFARPGAWALRDCSLAVPPGRVAALVGPNGAGKTTLLHVVVGLLAPGTGTVEVAGQVAFMSQDKALYGTFTVADMLAFGRRLNPTWDDGYARDRLAELGIPLDRKTSSLSGGQQAQVALTVTLARRPDLLVLDEPLANLDPLARHDVLRALMGAVAERSLTVLFSSHVVSDLKDTCDWLVVLNGGRVQVSGDIDDLLAEHTVLSGPAELADGLAARARVVEASRTGRQVRLLVRDAPPPDPRWTARPPGLEELVMAYLRTPDATALPRPTAVRA